MSGTAGRSLEGVGGGPAGAGEGMVVIGVPETVGAAASLLRGSRGGSRAIGAALVGGSWAEVKHVEGLEVLGGAGDLEALHERYGFGTALISLPGAMSGAIDEIRATLRGLGVRERFLPTIDDVLAREPDVAWSPATIDPNALLGRAMRGVDGDAVRALVGGKRVLVTGAGGSIGSELARRCAEGGPEQVILMERAENPLFEIDRSLAARAPRVARTAVLHDVVDAEGTRRRLASLRPHIVLHAAAHKHVPMMEVHPGAAVENNLFGTRSVADAADACGAERFVLISTDKAVDPTSVMGATKLFAEHYVRDLARRSGTRMAVVRFGNVLGSACSVLPIWASQVREGGPLTVTDTRMTRYFMTIPEAAALVLRAAALGGSGGAGGEADVFVLDMGEPVAIVDMAVRFLAAHGLEPVWSGGEGATRGMRVEVTGIRAGEKLHEVLAHRAEDLVGTGVEGVLCFTGRAPGREEVAGMVRDLECVRGVDDVSAVLEAIRRHAPTVGGSGGPDRRSEAA